MCYVLFRWSILLFVQQNSEVYSTVFSRSRIHGTHRSSKRRNRTTRSSALPHRKASTAESIYRQFRMPRNHEPARSRKSKALADSFALVASSNPRRKAHRTCSRYQGEHSRPRNKTLKHEKGQVSPEHDRHVQQRRKSWRERASRRRQSTSC